MSSKQVYKVVIVGGGVMGSSIAAHLALAGITNIAVIERDPTYKFASSSLSASGIRQQFSLPENIQMSLYGTNFLQNPSILQTNDFMPNFQFHKNGYLFLGNQTGERVILEANKNQRKEGIDWTNILRKPELSSKFPWLNTSGENSSQEVTIGSYGVDNEGYFDPWGLLCAFKHKSKALGVHYIDGECVSAEISSSGSSSHSISALQVKLKHSNNSSTPVISANSAVNGVTTVKGEIFVNATGPFAGMFVDQLIDIVGDKSLPRVPVEARKRLVFTVECKPPAQYSGSPAPPRNCPLVIDPCGVWFRPEGQGASSSLFITGVSPLEEHDPKCLSNHDLEKIDYPLYEEYIWPILANRVPAFEYLKLKSAWAGFYEVNTLDHNAIIGYYPGLKNLILCNGFSGHGVQQSPAAGRAVAELIEFGKYKTIDLSRFSFDRILNNAPLYEGEIAIV